MPAKNAEATIVAAIASVQNQTISDWELVVVDDSSTDRTRQILQVLSGLDSRITVTRNKKLLGPGKSRLKALSRSMGGVIAFLDADDIWLPEKLEEGIDFMSRTGSPWIHGGYRAILRDGNLGIVIPARNSKAASDFYGLNPIALSTAMCDRRIIPTELQSSFTIGSDRELWITLAKNGLQSTAMRSATMLYRLSSSSISGNKIRSARHHFMNLRGLDLSPLETARHFPLYAARSTVKYFLRSIPSRTALRERGLLAALDSQSAEFLSKLSRS